MFFSKGWIILGRRIVQLNPSYFYPNFSLVGGLEHFVIFQYIYIYGIILPIFFKMVKTTNQFISHIFGPWWFELGYRYPLDPSMGRDVNGSPERLGGCESPVPLRSVPWRC